MVDRHGPGETSGGYTVACDATGGDAPDYGVARFSTTVGLPHAKGTKRPSVHGHAIILEVPSQDRAQVGSLILKGRVHASPQFLSQGPQLRLPSLAHRLPQNREVPLPSLPTAVGKTLEVERLRAAFTTPTPILLRKAAKLDNARLVGMQLQAELPETYPQFN